VSRIPLPVIQEKPKLVECTSCGQCCTYVGISINAPSRPRYATDVLWYLYHENTYVYLDGDGEWSVHFEARCRNLGKDNLCGVYLQRPHICRGFDNRSCEVNQPAEGAVTFRDPVVFLDWLRENKPRVFAKIEDSHVPASLRPPARAERSVRKRAVARVSRSER
jgi:Fe-S-cluster containining protein